MRHSSSPQGFTLIEMLTVMLVIAILAGLVLSVNGLVQTKAARARAEGEMKALSLGCESYKVDNGSYPRNADTDALDARANGNAGSTEYQKASKFLYTALSGDSNANGQLDSGEGTNYAADFFKPNVLSGTKDGSGRITAVNYIRDPFDNSYGYSTIGAKAEEDFLEKLRKSATPNSETRPSTLAGYNPTFDLWSTAGASTMGAPGDKAAKWVKNW
jgi:prepilin-type N-terminal cleavage/methylation domain-containing protein